MSIKKLIINQRILSRRVIASLECQISANNLCGDERLSAIKIISSENKFLSKDMPNDLDAIVKLIHKFRHAHLEASDNCEYCKSILAQHGVGDDVSAPEMIEETAIPAFGNLISLLEQEVFNEKGNIERKRLPSQNDLTRWALKDAVLAYYQGLNVPENIAVVDNQYDDRLSSDFAPDFDAIHSIWINKLDELRRRNDKYTLTLEEYDKAEEDLLNGMRGSAFEKQLDRYREEFMSKLER